MPAELDPKFKSYLQLMAERGASDLFFTTGAPPSVKIEGEIRPVTRAILEPGVVKGIAYGIMDSKQQESFEQTKEMNLGLSLEGLGRFRVNIYVQRGEVSIVIRYIKSVIPTIEELNLPSLLKNMVMYNAGLLLVVGSAGSGKSTTLAAMIDYRNANRSGHILTIEDPIEYLFLHKRSIVGQREVGLDTLSYENALREAMREAPDLIMIGEIRDQETMKAANAYADTGHLVLSTLHAVNANQALERIVNFFSPDARKQILMDLSLNLRGIISQRLVVGKDGKLLPAVEILINTPYISELIRDGKLNELKEVMERGKNDKMQTFDQALYDLYKQDEIALATALEKADSRSQIEWRINFGGGISSQNREAEELAMPSSLTGQKTESMPHVETTPDPAQSASADAFKDKPYIHADSDTFADLKPVLETRVNKDS